MAAAGALSANGLDARRSHIVERELALAAQGAPTDVTQSGVARRRALEPGSALRGAARRAADLGGRYHPHIICSEIWAFLLFTVKKIAARSIKLRARRRITDVGRRDRLSER